MPLQLTKSVYLVTDFVDHIDDVVERARAGHGARYLSATFTTETFLPGKRQTRSTDCYVIIRQRKNPTPLFSFARMGD
jgi:hypothetical protein